MNPLLRDRIRGALVGCAAGDALGAGYEFGPPLAPDVAVRMRGGGAFHWAPGEWTDDTSMAVAIAEVAAQSSLTDEAALDRLVGRWVEWAASAPDVGHQTSAVLGGVTPGPGAAAAARAAARTLHERTGHTAGNGALMRTAPIALAHLDDPAGLACTARAVGELTHWDPDSGDACVLWGLAERHAVLTGELDVRVGLEHLPIHRRTGWAGRLAAAEQATPADFEHNGWVVHALQGAWSAIHRTGGELPAALADAVRGGRDTDTVAAIAGTLVGAARGESAVPAAWREALHGWPGRTGSELGDLAEQVARRVS